MYTNMRETSLAREDRGAVKKAAKLTLFDVAVGRQKFKLRSGKATLLRLTSYDIDGTSIEKDILLLAAKSFLQRCEVQTLTYNFVLETFETCMHE